MTHISRTPELEHLAVRMVGYLSLRLDEAGLDAASRPVAYDVIAAMLRTAADEMRKLGDVS